MSARLQQAAWRRRAGVVLIMAALVAATTTCGLDTLTTGTAAVAIALSTDTVVVVGGTTHLVAAATGGAPLAGVATTWASNDSAIASVSPLGVVTGLSEGAASVTVTLTAPELPPEGVSASRTVVVRFGGIVITPVDSLTGLGQSAVPLVRGTDVGGAPGAVVGAILTSSDTTVVRAVGNALVARRNGTATITAAYAGLTATASVKVRQVAKRIVFGVTPFVFSALGRDTFVTVTVRDTRDSLISAPALSWASLNAGIASVTAGGVLRALVVGSASIRVTSDTAAAILPTSVTQKPATVTKVQGDGYLLTAGSALGGGTLPTIEVLDAGGYPIAGVQVTFSVASGGGGISGAVQTTNAQGRATVGGWTLGTVAGANAVLATVGALSTTFGATGIPGLPVKLTLQAAPGTGNTTAAPLTPALVVAVRDVHDNIVTSDTSPITVALGVNPGGAALGGTLVRNAAGGVASFADLTLDVPGAGYTLTVASPGLPGATTGVFDVLGPPTKLAFIVQPANVTAAAAIAPAVNVAVQDAAGNTVTTATHQVTLALAANPAGGTLSGGAATAASGGVATFGSLSIATAGTGYSLTASAPGLASATSGTFTVVPGAPAQLVFVTQPSNTAPATAIAPPVQLAIRDALGNTVNSNATVTIGIGTNPAAGTLSGTAAAAASAGVASFGTLQINNGGNGYTLTATTAGLPVATSAPFNVLTAGPAAELRFVAQPGSATAGIAINPAITVRVVDSAGTTVNTTGATITLAFGANPNAGTLSGTLAANTSAGVATFTNVRVNRSGAGYTLVATSGTLDGDTSAVFGVTPGAASALAFMVQPSAAQALVPIAPAVQVGVMDNQGNVVPTAGASIALALSSGTGTLAGGGASATSNGVATFAGLTVDKVGASFRVTASASGFASVASSAFAITPGVPAALLFTTQPATANVGASLGSVAVTIKDGGGNTVTGATNPVTVGLLDNAPGAALGGTPTLVPSNGVATFTGLTLDKPGQGYTLRATATGLVSDTSNAFNAIGPATTLVFTAQPQNGVRNVILAPAITVEARDAAGNRATGFTGAAGAVTMAVFTNAGAGSLSGTLTRNAAAGIATFNDLKLDSAGTGYTIRATASGVTGITSAAFDVARFGVATKLVFLTQPTTVDSGATLPPVDIQIQDAVGNAVETSNATIALAFGANPGTATLRGTQPAPAISGLASFADLAVSAPGTGYTLAATSAGLTPTVSQPFNVVTPGSAVRLRFDVQPTNTSAGSNVAPSIVVSAVNSSSAIVTTATGTITLSMDSGPAVASLNLSASLVNGQATFSTARLTVAGNYRLRAAGSGLTAAVSVSFTISPGFPFKLAFTAQPTNTTAGTVLPLAITVEVEDQYGNLVPTAGNQVHVSLESYNTYYGGFKTVVAPEFGSGADADGNLVNAVGGVATFTALRPRSWFASYSGCCGPIGSTSTVRLIASSTGLTAGASSTFTLQSAPPVSLVVSAQPPTTVTGRRPFTTQFLPIDSLGNEAATGTEMVTVAISSGPTFAHLSGSTSATVVGAYTCARCGYGAANPSPVVDSLGTYILTASSPGLTSVNTSSFNAVASTAAQLGFVIPPVDATAGAVVSPAVRVCVLDAYGNEVRSAAGNVTVAFGANPGAATLGGTKTRVLVQGCADFTDLTVSGAGTGYTLVATGVVAGTYTSAPFDITP